MSDDSDDGTYFKGESFFNEKTNKNNDYNNEHYNLDNEEEECENNYNYNYYNDNEKESYRADDYYEPGDYDAYNSKYDFEDNYDGYNRGKYDYKTYYKYYNNYNNYNNDEYRYNNNFNSSYFPNYHNANNYYNNKERNDYNNDNNKENYTLYKGYQYYISSFQSKFRIWLLNTINKDKKDITFVHDKKINKEIIDTISKANNKEGKVYIDIKDVEIKRVVSNDININFTITMTEDIELFFIKKYIEIKVKGNIHYKKSAKFYFQVKQYKLSLTGEYIKNKNGSNNNTILNIEKNTNEDDNDILKLKLDKAKFRKNYDEDNGEVVDPDESLSKFLNELIESLRNE